VSRDQCLVRERRVTWAPAEQLEQVRGIPAQGRGRPCRRRLARGVAERREIVKQEKTHTSVGPGSRQTTRAGSDAHRGDAVLEQQRFPELEEEQAAEVERREREHIDAPRHYAESLTGCGSASVYYFDTNGDFQELGKERVRPPAAPPTKRVKMMVDEWVYGPSDEHQLESGESELVTVTRWVF